MMVRTTNAVAFAVLGLLMPHLAVAPSTKRQESLGSKRRPSTPKEKPDIQIWPKGDGKWQQLSLAAFKRGDVFQTDRYAILLAISDDQFVRVKNVVCGSYTTLEYVDRNEDLKIREMDSKNRLDKEVSLALALKMVGKRLPYGYLRCNVHHYMTYILWGYSYTTLWRPSCPTKKSLRDISLQTVQRDDFALLNGRDKPVKLSGPGSLRTFSRSVSRPNQ